MAKNKIIYIVVGVLVLAIVGGGLLLNKNKAAKNETSTSTTESSSVAPSKSNAGQTVSGSKVEEAYVEYAALGAYYSSTNNQSSWTEQKVKDLFAKYGVTQEKVFGYTAELMKDPAHAKAVNQKILQRIQELKNTGN